MNQKNTERKLRRLMATGDMRRLVRLREKLEEMVKHAPPRFRKSYAFEDWTEELLSKVKN